MEPRASRPAVKADVAQLAGSPTTRRSRGCSTTTPTSRRRDPGEGARRDGQAGLPAQPHRPGAGPAAVGHHRRIAFDTTLYGPASTAVHLEQAAPAAGYEVHVVTVPDLQPQSSPTRSRPAGRAVGHGRGRARPAAGRGAGDGGLPADLPAVAVEGAPPRACPRWWSTRSTARCRPPGTSSSSATPRSPTCAADRTGSRPTRGSRAGSRPHDRRRSHGGARPCWATGAPGRATRPGWCSASAGPR